LFFSGEKHQDSQKNTWDLAVDEILVALFSIFSTMK